MKTKIWLTLSGLATMIAAIFPVWADYLSLPYTAPWITVWFFWLIGGLLATGYFLNRLLGENP